jgi:hypothetical protein
MKKIVIAAGLSLALAGIAQATPIGRILREQALAAIRTADQVFRGASPTASGQVACATGSDVAGWSSLVGCNIATSSNTPTASGNVLCGTSSTAASFQSPSACGLATGTNYWAQSSGILSPIGITAPQDIEMATTSSSTTTPTVFGWTGMAAGQAVRFLLGDTNSGIQNASGDPVQIFGYHTIEMWGGEQGTIPPFSNLTADRASVDIIGESGASGGPALMVSKNVSGTITHGTAISFSGRTTVSRASASIAANTCAQATATLTGIVAGSDCHAGIGAASTLNVQPTCQYDGANAVRWLMCNPTTAAITFPASGSLTLSCRCWNP